MSYNPSQEILEKYAKVLVNFALNSGKGIKKGEVVRVVGSEFAKPLYTEVCRQIWRSGGHIIEHYLTDDTAGESLDRDFYSIADDSQIKFFPDKYYRGLTDSIDHEIQILGEADPHYLEGIDSAKMMQRDEARKLFHDWRTEKENAGNYTWTIAIYGTPAMAKEAGLTLEEYWQQIIDGCYLEEPDPIAKWREVSSQINDIRTNLNELPIERLHVEGEDVDLWITMGKKRKWMGGGGRNIPSFEIFTSPDWRGTEGWIRFNQPLYRYGNKIEGIRLAFKDGRVIEATASKNEVVLKEMIAAKDADKIGEYSLTDSRHSRITKFMADTLFDENMGGRFGNTHLAVGASYHDCYAGDPAGVTKEQWAELGFNDSSVHTDMISTTDRTVTAVLKDGSEKVIYRDGKFTV